MMHNPDDHWDRLARELGLPTESIPREPGVSAESQTGHSFEPEPERLVTPEERYDDRPPVEHGFSRDEHDLFEERETGRDLGREINMDESERMTEEQGIEPEPKTRDAEVAESRPAEERPSRRRRGRSRGRKEKVAEESG